MIGSRNQLPIWILVAPMDNGKMRYGLAAQSSKYNSASIYRIRKDPGHVAEHDLGICSPLYRGFRLTCTGAEIERLKRAIDDHWSALYLAANDPAERVRVPMREREMRDAPRDWSGT
jgi:hypothetical protein